MREIGQLLAQRHLNSDPVESVACFHRDDGDVEFMNVLANQLSPEVREGEVEGGRGGEVGREGGGR